MDQLDFIVAKFTEIGGEGFATHEEFLSFIGNRVLPLVEHFNPAAVESGSYAMEVNSQIFAHALQEKKRELDTGDEALAVAALTSRDLDTARILVSHYLEGVYLAVELHAAVDALASLESEGLDDELRKLS